MNSATDTLEKRIQIIKSLRECLLRQREKFQAYLNLLEKEEKAILAEDVDRIEHHVELEQNIVGEIYTLQRVINPLEDLYQTSFPEREESIQELRVSLDRLRDKVLVRNKWNREILMDRMSDLRLRIQSLERPLNNHSPYIEIAVPTMIDITS